MVQQQLQQGQRVPLSTLTTSQDLVLQVRIQGMTDLDLSIFGLDSQKKLSDDRYFIFYNQLQSPEGAISADLGAGAFTVALNRLPSHIERLLLAATSDSQPFSQLSHGSVSVVAQSNVVAVFEFSGALFQQEQALMLFEIYKHQGQWRVSPVAQGFNGGLQALLESLGGEVISPEAEQQASAEPPSISQWPPLRSTSADDKGLLGRVVDHLAKNVRLDRFRIRFLDACRDGIMEYHEWQELQRVIDQEKLDATEALEFVRSDALSLLERTLAIYQSDGEISQQEDENFNALAKLLQVPASFLQHAHAQIAELKTASQIRQGNLPTIQSSAILEAGEIAHFECRAKYRHVTASKVRDIEGKIIVTNRQILFISPTEGGWNIQYSKVLQIEEMPHGVGLALGVKKGNGFYQTDQPLMLGATLDALVRINKRLLLMPQTERASRSIPQHVKIAVWQRDAGKCTQCGATEYLEFDHIIPHSKGGATTEGNLQLLCRRCNLTKGDRL